MTDRYDMMTTRSVGHPWKYITLRLIYTNEILEILDWPAIPITYLITRLVCLTV